MSKGGNSLPGAAIRLQGEDVGPGAGLEVEGGHGGLGWGVVGGR